jgi:hypothetical protein
MKELVLCISLPLIFPEMGGEESRVNCPPGSLKEMVNGPGGHVAGHSYGRLLVNLSEFQHQWLPHLLCEQSHHVQYHMINYLQLQRRV